MKKLISLTLMLFILTGCITYNYEFLEDKVSYVGKTTISYEEIKKDSVLFVGNNYLFVINNKDNKFTDSKFNELINKMITENMTFILYGETFSDSNKFRQYSSFVNFCITKNIENFDDSIEERNQNRNCMYLDGKYYKIENYKLIEKSNLYKLTQSAKIKLITDKKSGVDVGATILRVPLSVLGLVAMVGAK